MKGLALTPFGAIFRAEFLFNTRRVAPYALMLLFSGNAVLWWAAGPAFAFGWAANSDFYIVRMFCIFSFMTLPLFTALIMADPVIRDFKIGVDPLIFSKPITRAQYLLGKFFGNFFVLVCCQASFALTMIVLQGFSVSGVTVLEPRLLPYLKHFFVLAVLSNLTVAAFCFTVGTLTRSVKTVYALMIASYALYITWQVAILKPMPQHWRVALDPLLVNFASIYERGHSADFLNRLSINYTADLLVNRALVLLVSAACLSVLYLRFSTVERSKGNKAGDPASIFNLAPRSERLYDESESFTLTPPETYTAKAVVIPEVRKTSGGLSAGFKQFLAASETEFRLLRAERSIVVAIPLAVFMCVAEVGYITGSGATGYAAAYASGAAGALLLLLFGVAVFYTGEAMHRDRELRVEPMLWSAPAPNSVLLLSKFAAVFLISLGLIILAAASAAAVQIYKGHWPVEIRPYLLVASVVVAPSAVVMISAAMALNVLLIC
jgi:ABC-2 type transport system permease protein